jgi:hypothetical protein
MVPLKPTPLQHSHNHISCSSTSSTDAGRKPSASARLLDGTPVAFKQTPAGLDLTVKKGRHDPINTVIELTLDASSTGLIKGAPLRSLQAYGE